MEQHNTHIVLGLGATGLSVVRYLCQLGITPLVMDSREQPPGAEQLATEFPDVSLVTGGFDCRYLVQATQIVVSPGIAIDTPEIRAAIDMDIDVIGDVELFARAIKDRSPCVIGITGSNGKSTVTTLVGAMAKAAGLSYAVGGNIGVPVLSLLDSDIDLFVLELSSFQLETTQSLNCISATCLNISEDHMDRYRDLEAYRQAKLAIYAQSKRALFNREDSLTQPNDPMNQNSFGLSSPVNDEWGVKDGKIVHGTTEMIALQDVKLVGSHNHANLIAAMALAYDAGIEKEPMIAVAKQFTGLAHRCELVATKDDISYVNDSKATNVGATVAALEGLSDHLGNIILIAGGDGKGADFTPLTSVFSGVSHLITLGKDGDTIAKLFKGNKTKVDSMSCAVIKAAELASAGDIVLLSPACASLDMYKNFMARGDDFRHQVQILDVEGLHLKAAENV
ncbi:UDP-N-acetylmuramoyl-L-alanine--D-glutamate ligase [Shewanella eurypsychrophilus]|uniref:UDP-N-acetylmuramoylalanine--D-glutamate ligase n=1 Tax=Shewanella eurypsychrophilus TaxID=2593656 RepID=A0ABX6V0Z9_9GAMM|nr:MULTISPECIES: UDP-N-acetylmuramoyl-L-alanine--D-glutamate ligase [Shewanella]QFU20729.1 UDP-N-acetylmuramoyl-L-alanine--D-glutamate ligase [Shewanella sp. YLB-09]QFU21007.1 UDP-N-acetylmuramoyl-L-alanine--D-glutamate ligase [Shewanella sp. YLB-09]QPG56296.1 UDP-N-acetylmuramoyl-L-alanine--D-glutamate ligase [Shewanella eurypsychrophilus]